jgi:4-hydroxy-4-methyl-2-oxoglutarate aldolase
MTDTNVGRAGKLDCASLSDAMDRLAIPGQCFEIKPLDHKFRLVGRAFTLLYTPVGVPVGNVGDFIDDVPENNVVVIDNGGRMDATIWGDILTFCAHRRKLAGTVIDGVCRDTALSLELNYPIYSKGYYMRTGKDRVQLEATGVPVTIGHVRVGPGDILRGDSDGIVALPKAREDEILEVAEGIERAEAKIREAVGSGLSLREARVQQQYHTLQRREPKAK